MRLVTQIGRAVLAAGVAALAWAPAAPAGTYDVVACNGAAAGGVNKSWAYGIGDLRGFRPESPAADPINFNNLGDCDTGIVARSAAGDPQRETGFGTSASLSFAAAPGTSIVGVVITRYGEARPSADDPNTEDPEDAVWDVFAQDGKDGSVIGGEFGGEVCRTQAGGPMCTVGAPGGSTSRKHDLPRSPRIT